MVNGSSPDREGTSTTTTKYDQTKHPKQQQQQLSFQPRHEASKKIFPSFAHQPLFSQPLQLIQITHLVRPNLRIVSSMRAPFFPTSCWSRLKLSLAQWMNRSLSEIVPAPFVLRIWTFGSLVTTALSFKHRHFISRQGHSFSNPAFPIVDFVRFVRYDDNDFEPATTSAALVEERRVN